MRLIFVSILLLAAKPLAAQWQKSSMAEYLAVAAKSPLYQAREKAFSYESDYLFFNTYDETKPALEFRSFFIQDEMKHIYQEQFGKQLMQDLKYKLVFDSVEKTLVLSDADSVFQETALFDVNNYKEQTDNVKKQLEGNTLKFYFELPGGMKYAAVEIWFDQADRMTKTIFYASQEIESETEGVFVRPRMEISYRNYSYAAKKLPKQVKDFIRFENETVLLLDAYKEFELIDLRKKI